VEVIAQPAETLQTVLREKLGQTATKAGCKQGGCGSCTVLINGEPVLSCLRTFNYDWSRRVLGRGAVVIVISDGWDRGDMGLLSHEMNRLSRSASRLIWLNPLAGADDYEPLAKGIQAALPFCDDFLPLHNLHSLTQLAVLLGELE
jgi:uncharacterized protein with von Willebrand factor type A (vWA) domain